MNRHPTTKGVLGVPVSLVQLVRTMHNICKVPKKKVVHGDGHRSERTQRRSTNDSETLLG